MIGAILEHDLLCTIYIKYATFSVQYKLYKYILADMYFFCTIYIKYAINFSITLEIVCAKFAILNRTIQLDNVENSVGDHKSTGGQGSVGDTMVSH